VPFMNIGRRKVSALRIIKSIMATRAIIGILLMTVVMSGTASYTSCMLQESSVSATELLVQETYPHLALNVGASGTEDIGKLESLLHNVSQIPQVSEAELIADSKACAYISGSNSTATIIGLARNSKFAYLLGIDDIQELESNEVYVDQRYSTSFSVGDEISISFLMKNGTYSQPLQTNFTIKGYRRILDSISEKPYPENDRLSSMIGNSNNPFIMNILSSGDIFLNQTAIAVEKFLLLSIDERSTLVMSRGELLRRIENLQYDAKIMLANEYQVNYVTNWIEKDINSLSSTVNQVSLNQYVIWIMLLVSDWFILKIIVLFLIRDSSTRINILRTRGVSSKIIWKGIMFSGIFLVGVGGLLGTVLGTYTSVLSKEYFHFEQFLNSNFVYLLVVMPSLFTAIAMFILWKPAKFVSYEKHYPFETNDTMESNSSRVTIILARSCIIVGTLYLLLGAMGISSNSIFEYFGMGDITTSFLAVLSEAIELFLTTAGIIILSTAIALLFSFENDRVIGNTNKLLAKINGRLGEISAQSLLSFVRNSRLIPLLLILLTSIAQISLMQNATATDNYKRMTLAYLESDAAIKLSSTANPLSIAHTLSLNPDIESCCIIKYYYLSLDNQILIVRSVNPKSWLQTAYYEDSWLENESFSQTITGLQENDIVLSKKDSVILGKGLGDWVNISYSGNESSAKAFRIVDILGSNLDFDGFLGLTTSIILQNSTFESAASGAFEIKILVRLRQSQTLDNSIQVFENNPDIISIMQASNVSLPLDAQFWIENNLFLSNISADTFLGLDISTIFLISLFQSNNQEYEIGLLKIKGIRNYYIFRIFCIGPILWNSILISVGVVVGILVQSGVTVLRNAHHIGSIKEQYLFSPASASVLSICCIICAASIILSYLFGVHRREQGEKTYD
jgi:ABC-type lipoprotein release transport system permease subunit